MNYTGIFYNREYNIIQCSRFIVSTSLHVICLHLMCIYCRVTINLIRMHSRSAENIAGPQRMFLLLQIAHVDRVMGVCLIHCIGTTTGFMESVKDKVRQLFMQCHVCQLKKKFTRWVGYPINSHANMFNR